jgi:hypothetical protein
MIVYGSEHFRGESQTRERSLESSRSTKPSRNGRCLGTAVVRGRRHHAAEISPGRPTSPNNKPTPAVGACRVRDTDANSRLCWLIRRHWLIGTAGTRGAVPKVPRHYLQDYTLLNVFCCQASPGRATLSQNRLRLTQNPRAHFCDLRDGTKPVPQNQCHKTWHYNLAPASQPRSVAVVCRSSCQWRCGPPAQELPTGNGAGQTSIRLAKWSRQISRQSRKLFGARSTGLALATCNL